LEVIDVGNPASPLKVGAYDTVGFARAVAVSGDYIYVVDGGGLAILRIVPDPKALKVELTDAAGGLHSHRERREGSEHSCKWHSAQQYD
jgi:hypothetical protein